ncbi:alpha/beta hydrolase [Mucilaginibacter pocheonensis]|uniref:Acetyl esterase/lipase n=1 Tax=Mucilaginibacter pocheonensis TaxID=398050 RepID=A0ABU1TAZ4_9SPHI|nr:alpha/beta hydrolase [Mucilaginibacter pocheonensis]MDR6942561.1 acetyl esterase/lipase [Mucilaginibacter pocheonensis]
MKSILSALILTIATTMAYSQEKPIPLYPKGVPNSKPTPAAYIEKTDKNFWITQVSQPTLTPYLPAKGTANGTAVVVCPGGGYSGLASAHEGVAVAQEFNKIGVTAFLLKYRLPSDDIMKDKSIGPLQDAQSAILIVREHAAEWGIDPNKIGIIGFSAGGHLVSTAGTHFDKPVIENKGVSVRPDFMMLIYPVITFGEQAHVGSRENLIGKTPSAAQIDLYSNEKQITANTPPTFLIHAQDDKTVPVQNSLLFYDALLKNNVKAEMHLFQEGGHGFGLNNSKNKGKWFDWATAWLDENGFLKGK